MYNYIFTNQIHFNLNPIFFEIGSIQIRYYGVFIAIGVILGLLIALKRAKQINLDPEIIYDLIIYGTLSGVIGGRILHVISNLNYYLHNPGKIVAIWNGGLSLHGGIFLGLITLILYLKYKRAEILKYLDVIAPSMVIAQALGRWGNFFNQEAFGIPTELPWGLYIDKIHRPIEYIAYNFFHPTFFYEFISNIFVFVTLLMLRDKKWLLDGEITFIYLIMYSVFRFFIEFLRVDSVYVGTMKLEQILSILIIIISCIFIHYRRNNQKAINI